MDQPQRPPATIGQQAGVTLVETAIALSVAAVLAGLAAPSFEQLRQRRQLENVAAQVETDLQHARGLAVARNQTLRVSSDPPAGATCYVIHTGAASACPCSADGTPVCGDGVQACGCPDDDPGTSRVDGRTWHHQSAS